MRGHMNVKFHYLAYKIPPPVPVLSQIYPLHAPHHISWYFTSILCSHPRLCLTSGLFPPRFPTIILIRTSLHTCYISIPSNLFFFDRPDNVWWEVKTVKFLTVQFSPFSSYFLPLIPKYLPQRHVHENIVCSSLNVADRKSHCHITHQ